MYSIISSPSIVYTPPHQNHIEKYHINERIIFQKTEVPSVITSDIKLATLRAPPVITAKMQQVRMTDKEYHNNMVDIYRRYHNREEYEINVRVAREISFFMYRFFLVMGLIFMVMKMP
jgi:hypothetical protein